MELCSMPKWHGTLIFYRGGLFSEKSTENYDIIIIGVDICEI